MKARVSFLIHKNDGTLVRITKNKTGRINESEIKEETLHWCYWNKKNKRLLWTILNQHTGWPGING